MASAPSSGAANKMSKAISNILNTTCHLIWFLVFAQGHPSTVLDAAVCRESTARRREIHYSGTERASVIGRSQPAPLQGCEPSLINLL